MNSRKMLFFLYTLLLFTGLFSCGEAPIPTIHRPLVDQDGDGHVVPRNGGRDCDDANPKINPESKEDPTDKKDNNCNGQTDEFTATQGRWSLLTPNQTTATWNIQIQTHKETGQQYIRCTNFQFKLQSSVNKNLTTNVSFWRSRMDPNPDTTQENQWVFTIPITNNLFDWKYQQEGQSLSVRFQGQITSETTMKGSFTLVDSDPNIKANVTYPFSGKFEPKYDTSEQTKLFCQRCLGSTTTCPTS